MFKVIDVTGHAKICYPTDNKSSTMWSFICEKVILSALHPDSIIRHDPYPSMMCRMLGSFAPSDIYLGKLYKSALQ